VHKIIIIIFLNNQRANDQSREIKRGYIESRAKKNKIIVDDDMPYRYRGYDEEMS
jgi:hypothetical protein